MLHALFELPVKALHILVSLHLVMGVLRLDQFQALGAKRLQSVLLLLVVCLC